MRTLQTLGEIADIVRGISFPKDAKSLVPRNGDVACLRTTNVQREVEWDDLWFVPSEHVKRVEQFVQPGDILISTANSYELVGKVALVSAVPTQSTLGAFISLIRPRAGVDPRFLYQQLAWGRTQSRIRETASTTTNISNVSTKKLAALELDVPPLDEQRRIVAELEKQFSRLDEAVANLKRVKGNLNRYRAAVLVQAINGTLVEPCQDGSGAAESGAGLVRRILDERARVRSRKSATGAPVEPGDIGGLPAVPATWTWATLDQIGQEGRSVIYGIIKPGPDTPGGVPYVRVTEMKDGYVDVQRLRRAAREREAKFSRARLLAGDLLISKDGTIGRVAVVPPELEGGNITQHVMRAPIHRFMNRDFVVWAIRSEFCQRWLTGETRGVALRGVNVEDFRRLPIPVPPRSEQDRIVSELDRRLSIVREVEAEVGANLKRADALRQAVLTRLLASTN